MAAIFASEETRNGNRDSVSPLPLKNSLVTRIRFAASADAAIYFPAREETGKNCGLKCVTRQKSKVGQHGKSHCKLVSILSF